MCSSFFFSILTNSIPKFDVYFITIHIWRKKKKQREHTHSSCTSYTIPSTSTSYYIGNTMFDCTLFLYIVSFLSFFYFTPLHLPLLSTDHRFSTLQFWSSSFYLSFRVCACVCSIVYCVVVKFTCFILWCSTLFFVFVCFFSLFCSSSSYFWSLRFYLFNGLITFR